MSISKETIDFTKQLISKFVAEEISKESNASFDDVLRDFLLSKTFSVLDSDETGLFADSRKYVLELYKTELSGNMDAWAEMA